MTDYEAINRRLRAERPDPPVAGSSEWRQARDDIAYANLAELERMAAELHRIWEAQGFPGGEWLDIEGTQKLARCVAGRYSGPDDYEHSQLYVLIDGRLAYYLKIQEGARHEARYKPPPKITFMSYRQRLDEQSKTLAGTNYETERYLQFMRRNLDEIRQE